MDIFSFQIMTYLEKLTGFKSLNIRQYPAELHPCILPLTKNDLSSYLALLPPGVDCLPLPQNLCRKSKGWGQKTTQQPKNCSFPAPEKSPSLNSNFHVITQYKFHLKLQSLLLYQFLTSGFISTYATLTFIHRCLLNVIFSMTKALNGQNSIKQNSILSTFQCCLENPASINAFLLIFSSPFFISNFIKYLLTPLQLRLHGLQAYKT